MAVALRSVRPVRAKRQGATDVKSVNVAAKAKINRVQIQVSVLIGRCLLIFNLPSSQAVARCLNYHCFGQLLWLPLPDYVVLRLLVGFRPTNCRLSFSIGELR